jgi:hypothetical protein
MRSMVSTSKVGRPVLPAGACGWINPISSPPRHHQVHLVKNLTLARTLGGQLESAGGKAFLVHHHLTHEIGATKVRWPLMALRMRLN